MRSVQGWQYQSVHEQALREMLKNGGGAWESNPPGTLSAPQRL